MLVRIVPIVIALHESAGITDHRVHGVAAAAPVPTMRALDRADSVIGRAAIYAGDACDVGAERSLSVQENVRVGRVELPIQQAVRPIVFTTGRKHRFDFGTAHVVGKLVIEIVGILERGEIQLAQVIEAKNLV